MLTPFIILAAMLPVILWVYIVFAKSIDLCAPTNGNGNDSVPVGGGIIFYIGALVPLLFTSEPFNYNLWLLMAGGAVLGVLSFADDMVKLPPPFRLVVQFMVLAVVLSNICLNRQYDVYLIAVIGCVGYANASNFMDGINGMLSLYGIVVLCSLLAVPYVQWDSVDLSLYPMGDITRLLWGLLLALAVFAIFNVRRHALVFAGDVGSVSLGYFIAVAIVWLSLIYNSVSMLALVLVYLIDTFCTFLQRLFNGERVMEAHRKHLYQRLVATGRPALRVSAAYAAIQLAVSAGWLAVPQQFRLFYTLVAALVLLTVFITLKIRIQERR